MLRHHCWWRSTWPWWLLVLCVHELAMANLVLDCGERKVKTVPMIVDGRPAQNGNWPWHTAIFHREGTTFKYKCGGTILNKNTILTAAHCVRISSENIASERLSVQVGRNQLQVASDQAQEHQADTILVHEKFRSGAEQHDIAIIKLATDILFTAYVQPVCLWNKGDDRLLIRDKLGTIVGFGSTGGSGFSDVLNEAELPVVDNQVCIDSNRLAFGQTLTSNMYCAGERKGKNACNGDSGGGMFFLYGTQWFVRGIISFSPGYEETGRCDPFEYVAFTDVARYIDWIVKRINATFVEAPPHSANNPKLKLIPQDVCGVNPYPFEKEPNKPIFLTYPWLGLIEYSSPGVREKKTLCHAILITERYLVSAAQCLFNIRTYKPTSVRLGDFDTSTSQDCDQLEGKEVCAPPTQTLGIETIHIHQQYNKPRYANDIALIRLRQPADISRENIKPICLPLTRRLRSYKPPTFTRVGWKGSLTQTRIQRAEVPVVESVRCQRLYSENRRALEKSFREICVERDAASTGCVFDISAAPLQAVQTVDGSPRYVLHGLLSFGPTQCQHSYPDVYANVGTYIDWILETIQE